MPTFNRHMHFAPVAEQHRFRAGLLRDQLAYVLDSSPFYRRRLAGVRPPASPEEAAALLPTLPLTARQDLERDNDAFRCRPLAAIREIVATSGTTGAPINLYLTAGDLEKLTVCEGYTFEAAGFTPEDVVQLCVTLDNLFMAGMAYYRGLERIGCTILRQGPSNPVRQLALLRRNGVTGIVTVPSFLNALAGEWSRQNLDGGALPLKKAVLVGENIRTPELAPNQVAQRIAHQWAVELYANYGNSEMNGSMCECRCGRGCHVHPDLYYAEIVDEAGRPLPPGETGLLAVTTLNAEGTPLLRYRTGDITFMLTDPCPCGRTSPRLGPILAREGQMLKVKGTKLYPSAIIDVMTGLSEIEDFVVVADSDHDLSDRVTVLAAWAEGAGVSAPAIRDRLHAALRIRPVVQRASREEITALAIPAGYRKKRVFVDQRRKE